MLGHSDPKANVEFAGHCANAAFGYVRAASAAYAEITRQALDFWASPASPHQSSKKGYQVFRPEPEKASAHSNPFDVFAMANPWLSSKPPMVSPVTAWWSMFPLEGNPMSWPMAYTMMQSGVPREVALPAADANISTMAAAGIASQQMERAYAHYRDETAKTIAHFKAQQVEKERATVAAALAASATSKHVADPEVRKSPEPSTASSAPTFRTPHPSVSETRSA